MTSVGLIVGTITVAVLLLLIAAARWHQQWSRRRYPPRGEFVEVRGVNVHYSRRGRGPPVLLLHGLNGFMEDWDAVRDELVRDHEVIVIDRPGHGYSQRRDRGLADPGVQAHWLVHLLDELGLDRPLIVGHSWGGSLAATFALRHPDRVRGLVLVAPYVYPRTQPDDWVHRLPQLPWLRSAIAHTFLVPVGRLLAPRFARAPFEPEPAPVWYRRIWRALTLRPAHFDTVIDEFRSIDPGLAPLADQWGQIEASTIIVTGDADRSIDHEGNSLRLAEVLPDAELVVLEGAGHMVPVTRPRAVVDAVHRLEQRLEGQKDA